MKLSVATYRASTERLASLRQTTYGTNSENRRGSSLDSGAARFLQSRKPSRYAITSVSLPKVRGALHFLFILVHYAYFCCVTSRECASHVLFLRYSCRVLLDVRLESQLFRLDMTRSPRALDFDVTMEVREPVEFQQGLRPVLVAAVFA